MSMDDTKLVKVLKALADPKRFRMVQEVAASTELNCSQIAAKFDLSQPTISHHLKMLTDTELLLVRQEAQHHYISVNHALLAEVAEMLPVRLVQGKQSTRTRSSRRAKQT